MRDVCVRAAFVAAGVGVFGSAGFASAGVDDPFADRVIGYTAGIGASAGFDDPAAALGAPTRVTAPDSPFGGATTPFQGAFGAGELVTVGEGGSLTVAFDTAVTNDALNPFGVDLLIFGNQFLIDADFPNGVVGGVFADVVGTIEVSVDGVDFIEVPGLTPEGGFPTLGFSDVNAPFTFGGVTATGTIPTDFTTPVDPGLDLAGLTFAEVLAGYAGSGGGLGIDIGALGLESISFVRISNAAGSGGAVQIDAFSDVRAIPSPGAAAVLIGAALLGRRRRA